MPDLIDSNTTVTDAYYLYTLHPSTGSIPSALGQCFTMLSTNHKITSCKFYMLKTGNPTGMAHAVLYAMTGTYGTDGKPTGDPLATSDDFNVSTLPTSAAWVEFTFSGAQQYTMQANTHYCIVFQNPTSGTINSSNYVRIYYTSNVHSGNMFNFANSVWGSFSDADEGFYVYGVAVAVAHYQTVSEILGMADSVGKKAARKRTYSEILGLADTVGKKLAHFKTVVEALGMADTVQMEFLLKPPRIIVTVDGKIILRISKGTKKKPDYISLS